MPTFRDFIPEGEDTDGLGNGFTDFVPLKEKPVEKPIEEAKVTPVKQKK